MICNLNQIYLMYDTYFKLIHYLQNEVNQNFYHFYNHNLKILIKSYNFLQNCYLRYVLLNVQKKGNLLCMLSSNYIQILGKDFNKYSLKNHILYLLPMVIIPLTHVYISIPISIFKKGKRKLCILIIKIFEFRRHKFIQNN